VVKVRPQPVALTAFQLIAAPRYSGTAYAQILSHMRQNLGMWRPKIVIWTALSELPRQANVHPNGQRKNAAARDKFKFR
jgi:hypothetical protein